MLRTHRKGFTLLELLIVITIIAILSVIIIIVLNPAETLKKSRDSQRISDLSTIKTALGIYITTTSTPALSWPSAGTVQGACKTGSGVGSYTAGVSRIYYSVNTSTMLTQTAFDASPGPAANTSSQSSGPSSTLTDGSGWIPVNLDQLTGGSPLSNYPLDPINTILSYAAPTNADLVYRYVCNASTTQFEVDGVLESTAYTVTDNKMSKDGGNNANYLEMGTNLKLLGTGTDF